MRRPDDGLLEPEIAETLSAIDAALAGEAVDPQFADVAELSLLLAAGRPAIRPEFAGTLDGRAEQRFGRRAPARPRRWTWSTGAFGAAGAALAAAVVVVAVVSSSGGGNNGSPILGVKTPATAAVAAPSSAPPAVGGTAGQELLQAAPATTHTVQPPNNGRKIIQSATLALGAPANRVDDVAQEVFNVVGFVNGIVDRSSVTSTGGPDGYAQFALRVPSASLEQAMSALSRLRYANVLSRTDDTQDVNNNFVTANRQLAEATALRNSLLKQLANATTQAQIDSLKAQIRVADGSIASAQATLATLNREVSFSRVNVTIQAGPVPVASGGGFGLHRAAHDALRVLTVGAGVALIALAVLIPLGLIAALGWWAVAAVRRRRREQALDLA